MWICKRCLEQSNQKVSKSLMVADCSICHSPLSECVYAGEDFNNEVVNWHKYSENNTHSSSLETVNNNGLYLWLRPDIKTDQHQGTNTK
jgi:hypothetical protein